MVIDNLKVEDVSLVSRFIKLRDKASISFARTVSTSIHSVEVITELRKGNCKVNLFLRTAAIPMDPEDDAFVIQTVS